MTEHDNRRSRPSARPTLPPRARSRRVQTSLSNQGPLNGVTLFTFARISAAIAEGDRPVVELLAAESLTEAQWTDVTLFWTHRMAEDARNPEPRVALAFS